MYICTILTVSMYHDFIQHITRNIQLTVHYSEILHSTHDPQTKGGFKGTIGWLAILPPFWEAKHRNIEKYCEYDMSNTLGRTISLQFLLCHITGTRRISGETVSIRLQFLNCHILGTCPIDSETPRYQSPPPPSPALKSLSSAPASNLWLVQS